MGRKKLEFINLPRDPQALQELIEAATERSVDPVLTHV